MHFASMAVREMIQHQNSMRLNKREREREKVDECSRKRRRERDTYLGNARHKR